MVSRGTHNRSANIPDRKVNKGRLNTRAMITITCPAPATIYSFCELSLGQSQLVTRDCFLNMDRRPDDITKMKRSISTTIRKMSIIPHENANVSTSTPLGNSLLLIMTIK
jgi:hypothetical protein